VGLHTKPLGPDTWADFARLAEDNRGVGSGCWCLSFHEEGRPNPNVHSPGQRRALKEARVRDGRAHAALVYDGAWGGAAGSGLARCVGWCQFGPAGELPRIKHLKAYREGLAGLPDWRITCFFVGRGHRGRGVADAALAGALEEIALLGGGTVESYPEDTAGRKVSGWFLYSGTVALFERHGFQRNRQLGKHHWVVSRFVG
jgi:GNAT superfamily N-acetyltransferase